MNMASDSMGLVAMPAADACVLQAFIMSLKASGSLSRSALRNGSQWLISDSNACRYDGTVLPKGYGSVNGINERSSTAKSMQNGLSLG